MTDNYEVIVQENLNRLYSSLPKDLAQNLPGKQDGDRFMFDAFGERCVVDPKGIRIGDGEQSSVLGILVSLYALSARSDLCILSPLKAFKEFPGSAPYVSAFTKHTEQLLAPHVPKIKESLPRIVDAFKAEKSPSETGGDFSIVVYPLPKIALCYNFYEADDEFPASVTCLYSNNAHQFMPVIGLADVGEYTSKKILSLLG
jgi:hypothetical protein